METKINVFASVDQLPSERRSRNRRISVTQELIPVNQLQGGVIQEEIREQTLNPRLNSCDFLVPWEKNSPAKLSKLKHLGGSGIGIITQGRLGDETPARSSKTDFFKITSRYFLVWKFINKLRSCIEKRNPSFLSMRLFKFINDVTFNFDVFNFYRELNFMPIYNTKARLSQIINPKRRYTDYSPMRSFENLENHYLVLLGIKKRFFQIAQFLSFFPVLDPSSKYKLIWDSVHCFFIILFIFKIPIELCFDVNLNWEPQSLKIIFATFIMKVLPIAYFFFDLLLNFSIGFYRKGKFVQDRKKIVLNYLKNNFIKDTVSFLAIILNLGFFNIIGHGNVFCLFFFLRLSNLKAIISRIEEYLFLDEISYNNLSLLKLFSRLFIICHFFACIWHLMALMNSEKSATWLAHSNLLQDEWWVKYIYSFYFVAITMATVGYGDILPTNVMEVAFCIIFVFFACGLFAYSLNLIGIILQDISKRENAFIAQIKVINGYMRKKSIPTYLRHRIRKYLEYLWDEKESQNLQEEEIIINNLSEKLRSELVLQANGHSLKKIKVLTMNFSETFLRSVVFILKEKRFMPGDIVFKEGDSKDLNLYLIRDGEIEIFLKSGIDPEGQILQKLYKGEVFGEFAFFSDNVRGAFARSTDFTTLISIERQEFINLLKKFPEDYEKYCHIRDNILHYNDMRELYINCYACEKSGHSSFHCPNVHRPFLKDICLKKHLYSVEQPRNIVEKSRRLYLKVGVIDGVTLKDDAMRFVLNNESLIGAFDRNDEGFKSESYQETDNYFSEDPSDNSKLQFYEEDIEDVDRSDHSDEILSRVTEQDYQRQRTNPDPDGLSRSRLHQIRNSDNFSSRSASKSVSVNSSGNIRRRDAIVSKSRFSIISKISNKNLKRSKSPKIAQILFDVNKDIDVMRSYSHYSPQFNIKPVISQLDSFIKRRRKRNRTSKLRDIGKFIRIFDMNEIQREKYIEESSVDKFFDFAEESSVYQKLRDQVTKVMKRIEENTHMDKQKFASKRRKSIVSVHPLIIPKPTFFSKIKSIFDRSS